MGWQCKYRKKKTAEAKRKCEELKNNFRIRAELVCLLLSAAAVDGRRGIRISKEKKCFT